MIWKYLEELQAELSGARAREHVSELGQFFRSPGSAGFHAAIDYVDTALDRAGVEHAVTSFPLDGTSVVMGMRVPLAWEPRAGTLEVVSPERETLISWGECPSCIPWWCPPTPTEGSELELADVGDGQTDGAFESADVSG